MPHEIDSSQPICVLGLWHLGSVTAAALADLGFDVKAYDPSSEIVANLKKGTPPLFEPGLETLITAHLKNSRLHFESDLKSAVAGARIVLITYDTPVNENDQPQLEIIEETLLSILPFAESDSLILISSQIPVGSCERWQRLIDREKPNRNIDIVYSPENLRLGQALELYKNPDMLILGYATESARRKAELFYRWTTAKKFFVSWETAEMAKHALNAFFATSISFANELGALCEAAGADGLAIAKILKQDKRIGAKAQVTPGLGFAGGTLARDITALQNLGEKLGVPTTLLDQVLQINRKQTERLVNLAEQHSENGLQGKTFTVLGLTYKAGTSTLRRSVAIELIRILVSRGAVVKAHDPKADLSECHGPAKFEFCRNPYSATEDSSGIFLLTDWPEYQNLDYGRIKKSMRSPFILDAKNFLSHLNLQKLGFVCVEVGRGQTEEEKVK